MNQFKPKFNQKMKKNFLILIMGLFGSVMAPISSSFGQVEEAALALALYEVIDSNCDDKRTEGTLQTRCKDGACVTVSCISFRKACSTVDDCQ
ncbi:hypothetical protein ACFPIK_11930 [Algoriphagus aquatilis]|uniref:NVEALA protein n=1 Tax=Algoriphagus aquatilis TaxID=490186 RepID=A0ABW0BYE5_9BACT